MGQRIKKLKKIRLHREGTDQLVYGMIAIVAIAAILWSTKDYYENPERNLVVNEIGRASCRERV